MMRGTKGTTPSQRVTMAADAYALTRTLKIVQGVTKISRWPALQRDER